MPYLLFSILSIIFLVRLRSVQQADLGLVACGYAFHKAGLGFGYAALVEI
jgi:hypothetical protein